MANGLLSPDDMMLYGADGLEPTTPPERYFRHPILPIGWDWSKPPAERKMQFGAPMILAEPTKVGKGLMDYFTGTMSDGMGYFDTTPTYDYEPSPQERFENAGVNFALDFGVLPSVAGAVARPAASNTLRMGAGGGQTKNVRSVDDLGFYSEALEQAKMLPMDSGTGEQFYQMLINRGVKPDEIKYTPGLESLLSEPKVTRDEVVSLLGRERLLPDEQVYSGDMHGGKGSIFGDLEILDIEQSYGRERLDERINELKFDEDYTNTLLGIAKRNNYWLEDSDLLEIDKAIRAGTTKDLDGNLELVLDEAAYSLADEMYRFDGGDYRLQVVDDNIDIVGNDMDGYRILVDGEVETDFVNSLDEAQVQATAIAQRRGRIGEIGSGKWASYTEDGGYDYNERLLIVDDYEGKSANFGEGVHFPDDKNVAVFARTKTRLAGDGESTLYVEELQSDWGQQGRSRGFDRQSDRDKIPMLDAEAKRKLDEATEAQAKLDSARAEIMMDFVRESGGRLYYNPYGYVKDKDGNTLMGGREIEYYTKANEAMQLPSGDVFKVTAAQRNKINNLEDDYLSRKSEAQDASNKAKIFKATTPVAPFVQSTDKFTELGIKRLLKVAADEGHDYLSFTTGDIQSGRWNEKGLKKYYDDIIPKQAQKVIKRLDPDAKIETIDIEDLGERMSIRITDKMRESLEGGQPLFTTPVVPMGGILADEDEKQKQGLL